MTEEQKAARREIVANNKAWDSATTVRRAWLTTFFARKTAPPEAARWIADKAAGTNRDVDVVVYGKTACLRTHARINGQLPPRGISHPHHLQFQIPGGAVVLDPRFIAPHTITRMLITGDYTDEGTEPIDGLWVIDAADGIFYPSRYTLSDDSVLLSYRVGHSAWLHPGDVLSGPPLPVYQRDGIRYRMLLGCATLTPHRREAK
ncbi:MAG TPA: hypothetical protein VHY21_07720 [Pseudonocardiaceae bacterium]|jgi:hypothetical protein|nr:hypothetical protein [Pseudonocardiaceae bacterium]